MTYCDLSMAIREVSRAVNPYFLARINHSMRAAGIGIRFG